ncbi:hypothetical protein NQ176_g4191 [Zarea fungicola]|uniref:Uncharacterized protein n=1 Tax=Zarea fungicola TaxID=93591 RepID=A0ACC1NEL7_9HYPO|nr:hypothetical protein NQ176_g4191 [Lecanicillium fungicola]
MVGFSSFLATLFAATCISSGVKAAGLASWYQPNGNYGACGLQLYNNDNVIAIPPAFWHNKANCHKKVLLEYRGKKIITTIEDLCPSCASDKIDLTEGLFRRFDSTQLGILKNLEWKIL